MLYNHDFFFIQTYDIHVQAILEVSRKWLLFFFKCWFYMSNCLKKLLLFFYFVLCLVQQKVKQSFTFVESSSTDSMLCHDATGVLHHTWSIFCWLTDWLWPEVAGDEYSSRSTEFNVNRENEVSNFYSLCNFFLKARFLSTVIVWEFLTIDKSE